MGCMGLEGMDLGGVVARKSYTWHLGFWFELLYAKIRAYTVYVSGIRLASLKIPSFFIRQIDIGLPSIKPSMHAIDRENRIQLAV